MLGTMQLGLGAAASACVGVFSSRSATPMAAITAGSSVIAILVLLIGMAVAFHQANLLVALWMLPAIALCAILGWRPSKAFLHGLFAGGIGLTFGVVALLTANLVVDGRFVHEACRIRRPGAAFRS